MKIRQICELQRRPPDDAGSHELAGSKTKQVEALQSSTYKEGGPLKEKEVDKLHNRAMVDALQIKVAGIKTKQVDEIKHP